MLTFIVAFAVIASGITSASALARGFGGDYLSEFVDLKVVIGALLLLAAITLVNLRGIAESVKLNVVFTAVEVFGLLLIVLIAVVAIVQGDAEPGARVRVQGGDERVRGDARRRRARLLRPGRVRGLGQRRRGGPQPRRRTYPKVLFVGLAIAGVLYFLVTVGASAVVPTGDLVDSSGPLLEVVKQGPLGIPEKLFSAIGLLALSNGALINMIMASRLLYGMAKEDVVPAPLGTISEKRRTPWVAILFTTAIAAVLIITGDLSKLADTTVALLVIVFAIVNVSVLVLRRRPGRPRPFPDPVGVPGARGRRLDRAPDPDRGRGLGPRRGADARSASGSGC